MVSQANHAGQHLQKVLDRFINKISFHIFDHYQYKRFIVLSRSRTGSNLLLSYLNAHPNVNAESEIFARLDGRRCIDILSSFYGKQPIYVKARGFKIFYYHPLDDESREIWDILLSMRDLRVIHLKRWNILRTLISRKIAGIQDTWLATDSNQIGSEKPAVTFTKDELEHGFRQTREWEVNGDFFFRNHPLMTIYYEDLVGDPEGQFKRITDFLGVRYVYPKSTLRRQNPENTGELLCNYGELKTAFNGTEWQEFFSE